MNINFDYDINRMAQKPKIYTTVEAAKLTDIPENTIRSWMSRNPGQFTEGKHYIVETSGRKMWTEEGIEFLKSLTSEAEAETESTQILEQLLDSAATHSLRLPILEGTTSKGITTNPPNENASHR